MKQALTYFIYVFLIGVVLTTSCQKEVSCSFCESNKPPIAHAGSDQNINLPTDSVFLDGSASGDADGRIVKWEWTKVAGPASFRFSKDTSMQTYVAALVQGVYLFELKVTDDGGLLERDTVQVTVANASVNGPPVACAGTDQSITLPANSVVLNASCSSDPNHNISTYTWTTIAGPSNPKIDDANKAVTLVTGLTAGVYQFGVTVTDDKGLSSKDSVMITVTAANAINCGTTNRPMISARLVPVAKLSEPSAGMAVASAGNKIVFAGATVSGNPARYGSDKVYIFDITSQTLSTAKLSESRTDIAAVAAGNKIFFAGGRLGIGGNDQHFSAVDIYDVTTNTWTVASLSQSRAYIAAATVGNKVIFGGGEREWPHPVSDRVDVYDLPSSSWSTTSLSQPRNGISAVSVSNKVFFAGGSNQQGGVNNVSSIIDVYDNVAGTWSVTSLNESKAFFAGIATGNKIYWAGGDNASGVPSCTVEVKDLATQTSSTSFLYQPFNYVNAEGQNAVIKNNKIIWFATINPLNGNATDKFNIFDITTNTWSIGVLPFTLSGASVIAVNNTIYVAGGNVNGTMSDAIWRLEF